VVSPLAALSQGTTVEYLPICFGGKSIEVLVGTAVHGGTGSPDDPAEVCERFFIHLVIFKQLGVVAKITEKRIQFPQSSFGAVQPPGEKAGFEGLRFQNDKPDLYEGLLWMPPIGGLFDTNQK
jgi:hypothetical protein